MKLIFIRHGDPDYINDSLTEKGVREAACLAKRVSGWDIRTCYSSPLGRAKQTASLALAQTEVKPVIKEWLQEFYVRVEDPVTGMDRIPWDLMPAYWTKEPLMYDKEEWVRAPIMQTGNVETTWKQVCTGIDEVLQEHGYKREGAYYRAERANEDTLVFFCHLGVTCAILSHLLGISAPALWQGFFLAPTSITMLVSEERIKGEAYFRCKVMGDTGHLSALGEPVSDSGFFCETYREDPPKKGSKKNWL